MKAILKYVLIELMLLAAIVMFTKRDFAFHIFDTIDLTADSMIHSGKLSYDRHYRLNSELKYYIPVESTDQKKSAALIWPTEPYSKLLIVSDTSAAEIKSQKSFEGRLHRCAYKCYPSEMLIEMFQFVDSLQEQFPNYKGKFDKLPSIVLNTLEEPQGFHGYVQVTRYYWAFYAIALTFGGLLLIRSIILSKSKKSLTKNRRRISS